MFLKKNEMIKLGLIAMTVTSLFAGCNSGDSESKASSEPTSVAATGADQGQAQDTGKDEASSTATVGCFNVTDEKGADIDPATLGDWEKLTREVALLASVDGAAVGAEHVNLFDGETSVVSLAGSSSMTVVSSSVAFAPTSVTREAADSSKQETAENLHFVLNETVTSGCDKEPGDKTPVPGQDQDQDGDKDKEPCVPESRSKEVHVSMCLNIAHPDQDQDQDGDKDKAPDQGQDKDQGTDKDKDQDQGTDKDKDQDQGQGQVDKDKTPDQDKTPDEDKTPDKDQGQDDKDKTPAQDQGQTQGQKK